MTQPTTSLLYNQEKAGLQANPEQIANKIAQISKETKYYELQKSRSKNIDHQISQYKDKIKSASQAELDFSLMQVDCFIDGLKKKYSLNKHYLHADLDAFFASVEALDDPSLIGVPFAVGGSIRHGVISTSSYEARKFGVRSGMAVFIAMNLCPELKIVAHHGDRYSEMGRLVRTVFAKYDPNYVSFSLDEATLDISPLVNSERTPYSIAKSIQEEVFDLTKLTISLGIGHSKMLSKMGSDINKPNGIYIFPSDHTELLQVLSKMTIRKVPGVGGVSEHLLHGLGIQTIGDVFEKRGIIWYVFRQVFCKFLFSSSLGVDNESFSTTGPQQSISKETTFDSNSDLSDLMGIVDYLSNKVSKKMQRMGIACRTVTVKFKDEFFQVFSKCYTFDHDTASVQEITNAALKILLDERKIKIQKLRLLGVRVSNLVQPGEKRQVSLKQWTVKQDPISSPPKIIEKPKEKPKTKLFDFFGELSKIEKKKLCDAC